MFMGSCGAEAIVFAHSLPNVIAGIALFAEVAAQALRYWAVATLGERWNTRIVVTPEKTPVTTGPYRFMRHPNYLAVVIEIAAVPVIGRAIFPAGFFFVWKPPLVSGRKPSSGTARGR